MTDAEHALLVEQERLGKILVGVDRIAARQFFSSVSVSKVYEVTGYAPHIEKASFVFVFAIGPLALIASIVFAFLGFGWWGAIALIVCPILYFGYQASSSSGGSGASAISILLVVAVGLYVFDPISVPYLMGSIVLFVLSLWCARMVYVSSIHFYRAMALQNAKLFNLLSAGIELRQVR